jgi:predicted enzyme related to lactoylglutathione lyase
MAPAGFDFGLSSIGQIAVTVRDLEEATAFYRDVLGMQLLFEAEGMSFFQCGDIRLMIGMAAGEEGDAPSHIIYFNVEDISAAHDALAARGVEFVSEPAVVHRAESHELWLAFFRDSDGNTMALLSEVPVQ